MTMPFRRGASRHDSMRWPAISSLPSLSAQPLWTRACDSTTYLAVPTCLKETVLMSIGSPLSGGQILIVQRGGHVYCVPGESYLAALDALHDSTIEVVICRQEAGAAMAALTAGRL